MMLFTTFAAVGAPRFASGFNSHWRIIGSRGTVLWDGNTRFQVEIEDGDTGFQRPVRAVEVPDGDFGIKAKGHGGLIRSFWTQFKTMRHPKTRAQDNIRV
jgi:predicted dehydrogenase